MISHHARKSVAQLLLCIVLLTTAINSSVADEKDDWSIGKVFLSRADRLVLDSLRSSPQATEVAPTSSDTADLAPSTRKLQPTGYFLSSDGSPYRWKDGDFQKTSREAIVLSGGESDVKITKHQRAATPNNPPVPTNESPQPTTGSDSDRRTNHDSER